MKITMEYKYHYFLGAGSVPSQDLHYIGTVVEAGINPSITEEERDAWLIKLEETKTYVKSLCKPKVT